MSNHQDENRDEPGSETSSGISDEDLPEDLQPSDDNPLAKPLTDEDDPKSPEELDMRGGKTPERSDESSDDESSDDNG